MTQNIEHERCACFQEKCIARAVVNESVINQYVRQLNTSCQGPGSVLTIKYASYLGGLYD